MQGGIDHRKGLIAGAAFRVGVGCPNGLMFAAGCWRATVYNRVYHPRGYVRPEDGGAAAEHEALTRHVTLWNVAGMPYRVAKGFRCGRCPRSPGTSRALVA